MSQQEFANWPDSGFPWRKSLIAPIVLIVAMVLLPGLLSNLYFGIQSINSLARLIHDKDVDKTLESSLKYIREVHNLRQQLLIERLKPYIKSWMDSDYQNLSKIGIQTWLNSIEGELIPKVEASMITQTSSKYNTESTEPVAYWIDKEHLQVLNFHITFPKKTLLYQDFTKVKDIRQLYHLMGTELFEQIRPSLILINVAALIISFLLLAFFIFIFAKSLQKHLRHILFGLECWRNNDFKFRFTSPLPGELNIIAMQFNAMAKDIETNRQKTLYLEKVASWQVIARKLAHEIKNPLTPIQMMVSQLVRAYKGNDEKFRNILNQAQEIITEEVSGLRHMVDHFSNFARLPDPSKKVQNIVPILCHVIELQKAAFLNHRIVYKGQGKPCLVNIDEKLIRQVILNLIKNAAEASTNDDNNFIPVIQVDLYYTGSQVMVEVEDNGPGIPEEIRKRIFEAYFTTKHTGPSPGMGLGLAICQKIIIDHGGEMTVESQPGQTKFILSLPRHQEQSEDLPASKNRVKL